MVSRQAPTGTFGIVGLLAILTVITHTATTYNNGSMVISPGSPTITNGPDGKLYVSNSNNIQAISIIPANQVAISGNVVSSPTGTGSPQLPLFGQTVYLDLNHDGNLDPGDPTTSTDLERILCLQRAGTTAHIR